jgi:beta-glucanase (GH16 family)
MAYFPIMKTTLFILLCLSLFLSVHADPPAGKSWVATFTDDFSGSALDTTVWNRAYRWGGAAGHTLSGNGELEWYADDAFELSGGTLRIRADKHDTTYNGVTYPYTSGVITSLSHFSQKYGYFEMRTKIPSGKGFWPAFWLLADEPVWPPEIDIFEILGHEPAVDYMTYHWSQFGVHHGSGTSWTGPDLSLDFHVYGLEWFRGTLVWTVDGVERRRLNSSWLPNDGPMYIIVNLAVGGTWPGSPDVNTVFPAYMDVDYVKAWQYTDTAFAGVNQWPQASFDFPKENAYVIASPSLTLSVSAHDPDGSVAHVDFYNDTNHLLQKTTPPYTAVLTGLSLGKHTFYAQVFDNEGAFTTLPLHVTVIGADGNLITNPQFDDSLNGWFTSFSNGASGGVTTSNVGLSGAHAARFSLANGGGVDWYALLGQNVLLSTGQPISISFKAKANGPKRIQAVLQRAADPWNYFWSTSIDLTTQPQVFGPFQFSPTETAEAWLKFFVGGDTTGVWLDSIVCAVKPDTYSTAVSKTDIAPTPAGALTVSPMPFTSAVDIGFSLTQSGDARLSVYSIDGRLVSVLLKGPRGSGIHSVQWNGQDMRNRPLASGLYVLRLEAEGRILQKRIIRLE